MKCGSCMTLPSVPDIDCYNKTLCLTPQDILCAHARSCSVSGALIDKWYIMISCQWAKPSLWTLTCTSWNVHNRHWSKSQHWLITIVYFFSITTSDLMWCRWPGIWHCVIYLTLHSSHQQITTSSNLDNHLQEKSSTNESDLQQTLTGFFTSKTPDHCTAGGTLANVLDADYFEK